MKASKYNPLEVISNWLEGNPNENGLIYNPSIETNGLMYYEDIHDGRKNSKISTMEKVLEGFMTKSITYSGIEDKKIIGYELGDLESLSEYKEGIIDGEKRATEHQKVSIKYKVLFED